MSADRWPFPYFRTVQGRISLLVAGSTLTFAVVMGALTVRQGMRGADRSAEEFSRTLSAEAESRARQQVEMVVSLVDGFHARQLAGALSEAEARQAAADVVRSLHYGVEGYFWVDTFDGVNVVLYGSAAEGKPRLEARDARGGLFVQQLIAQGRQPGGGFTDYWFSRKGETAPAPKRGYSLAYEPYRWVIGTGFYRDTFEQALAVHRAQFEFAHLPDLVRFLALSALWLCISLLWGARISRKVASELTELDRLRESQAALDHTQRDLQAIFDHVPAMIAYFDLSQRCRFANREYLRWFGLDPITSSGQLLSDFLGPEQWLLTTPYVEAVLRGETRQFERTRLVPGEEPRFSLVQYLPDLHQERGVQGFYVLASDITAIKKAELAATEANTHKSRFLATMSHELRTPLNAILGMAQLLMDPDTLEPGQRDEFPRIIAHAGKALLTILNDILDLAKIESGKYELTQVEFSPEQLLGEVGSIFGASAAMRSLTLRQSWDGPPGAVYLGDAVRLGQMLSNLVSNAIKFTTAGAVEVRGCATADGLRFAVRDTGPGLSAAQQHTLFKPFVQLDASNTRQHGGTGMGLAIVRQLALLMGGEAGVVSEEGAGAEFWFSLQAVRSAAQAPLLPATPSPATHQGLRVLVVEDLPMNATVVLAMLRRLGCTAERLSDGLEAVEAARAGGRWDVVLMDVQMPRLDGLEATRAIRALERAAGQAPMPIIALTASAYSSDVETCLAAGMDELLSKPVRLEQLSLVLGRRGRRLAAA